MGMGTLKKGDIEHVAKLAHLPLKSKELIKFKSQLSDIFSYVDKIAKMKTKGVKETSQVTNIKNRFRQDKVEKERMLGQKEALLNAKKTYQGYFLVKAIFKE